MGENTETRSFLGGLFGCFGVAAAMVFLALLIIVAFVGCAVAMA